MKDRTHKHNKNKLYKVWSYDHWETVCTECMSVIRGQSFYNYER